MYVALMKQWGSGSFNLTALPVPQLLARVHMQSLTYISSSWSAPSHRLWVGGDLRLQQTLPLPSAGISTTYNVSEIFSTVV